jgi:NADPH:quinone reductase-like Zn-dependent oxidoreductase
MQSGHNRPISAHFRSSDFEFAYFGEDLGKPICEPVEASALIAVAGVRAWEKEEAAKLKVDGVVAIDSEEEIEHLHDLDAIADTVGGTTIQRLLKRIRKGGVLGSVLGEPEGAKKYDIRVEAFMAQPDASRLHQLADDVARHEFSIPIARTMKLQEIQEAHRIFERGGLSGKIVLVP